VNNDGMKSVNCKWCGTPTTMDHTRSCDACYDLYCRIKGKPQLAQRMLNEVVAENMKAKKVRK